MMKVIGLAGRAGSGKSTIARVLAQRPGIEWVDLDRVAWQTYAQGTSVYQRLIEAFGEGILTAAGDIDRACLAAAAFADETSRATLNGIVHPAVDEAVQLLIRGHRERGAGVLIIEGALLATSPHVDRSMFDCMIWLDLPEEDRLNRLQQLGRGEHVSRGLDVSPTGSVVSISSQGSIDDVVHRILRAIDGVSG